MIFAEGDLAYLHGLGVVVRIIRVTLPGYARVDPVVDRGGAFEHTLRETWYPLAYLRPPTEKELARCLEQIVNS
jgi:hypothetical protein